MATPTYPGKGKRKRRILKKIALTEISAVPIPAQEGALAAIMKGATPLMVVDPYDDPEMAKRAALTTARDGHTHLVHIDMDGVDLNNGGTSWEDDHSHPWIREEDGSIKIGAVAGHTHSLAAISKNTPEDGAAPAASEGSSDAGSPTEKTSTMTPEEIQELQDKNANLQKEANKSKQLATLNDAQREYHKGLEGEDADAFLNKPNEDRQKVVDAELKKVQDKDAVVYTADNGDEFRKSDDPRVVKMAKERDVEKRETKEIREEAQNTAFAKRAADELGNTVGEEDAKVDLLKAVTSITDLERRKAVEEILKAADGAFLALTKSAGHSGVDDTISSADTKLEAFAKGIQEKDGISFSQAMTKALETDEGKTLYGQARAEADAAMA